MKKKSVTLIILLILIGILGFLILNETCSAKVYDFTFNNIYIFLLIAFIFLALIMILFDKKIKLPVNKEKLLKITYNILFLPFVFYPIFKCYFKIPWAFCHVCPTKCIFGHLRPYAASGVLLINADGRRWCYGLCPAGAVQDGQASMKNKKIKLPDFLKYVRYAILALFIITYFLILNNATNPSIKYNFYDFMFRNIFAFSSAVFVVFIIILLLSFFINRFWCNYFCPIGTVSDLGLKAIDKVSIKK